MSDLSTPSTDRLMSDLKVVVAEGECLIEVVEPAGSDTFAVTHLGGKEVVARLRADARIQAGQPALLAFNVDKAVFFDPQSQRRIA